MSTFELSLAGDPLDQTRIQRSNPFPDYPGEVPQHIMDLVLATAEVSGIEKAAASHIAPCHPALLKRIFDEQRWNALSLLNLTPGQSALDVGCGFGCLTEGLARSGCSVIANDSAPELIQFTAARCRDRNLSSIRFVVGSFMDIDIASASLHVIVMNGVLEKMPMANREMLPDRVQLACLKRSYEMLKPGGQLYLGVENRFSWSMPKRDPARSGVCLSSMMNGSDANSQNGLTGDMVSSNANMGHPAFTRSLWGYLWLLRRAGFLRVRAYWPVPGHYQPYQLVPIKNRILRHWEANRDYGRRRRLVRSVLPFVTPVWITAVSASDFIFIAEK